MLALTSSATQAQPQDQCLAAAHNTLEINECLISRLKETERDLDAVYKRVITHLSKADLHGHVHYSEAKQELARAQRAWIRYRDSDCKAVYALAVGASMRGQLSLRCRQSRAEQRIKELEQFLEP